MTKSIILFILTLLRFIRKPFPFPQRLTSISPARENRNPAAGGGVICHKPGQGRHNSGCGKFAVDTPFVSC